jgi:hypothetical protein
VHLGNGARCGQTLQFRIADAALKKDTPLATSLGSVCPRTLVAKESHGRRCGDASAPPTRLTLRRVATKVWLAYS